MERENVSLLRDNIAASGKAMQAVLANTRMLERLGEAAAAHVVSCYQAARHVCIAGNGGSAADSKHLAAEMSDYRIIASGLCTSANRELHIMLAHSHCECVGQ